MPQHDYNIANAPGATVRADINNALSAILSQNSDPTEPTVTVAYMIWVDTSTTIKTHKQRNSTDSAWIILHKIDATIVHKDDIGANIASAATVDLADATGKTNTVTGAAAITSFGTVDAGFNYTIVFSSNPVITHNVTSLILPGGANITAAAGDVMQLVSLGSGNWRCTNYTRASGVPITPAFVDQFLHIQDQKTTGTPGGTFTLGAERTRDLNIVLTNEITGASLALNQITLPAGTYYAEASAPGYKVRFHRVILRDITGSVTKLVGTSQQTSPPADVQTVAFVSGRFTLSVTSALEIQHRADATHATTGLGFDSDFGPHEVYTDVKIWKVG